MSNKETERHNKLLKDIHGLLVTRAVFNFSGAEAYGFSKVLESLEGAIGALEQGYATFTYEDLFKPEPVPNEEAN
jgi:hypothetical protein